MFFIKERIFKMILSVITAYFVGKLVGLGVCGIIAWFFVEVLGGILTMIIDNFFLVLTLTIVVPFVIYWLGMGLGKFLELFEVPPDYFKKRL